MFYLLFVICYLLFQFFLTVVIFHKFFFKIKVLSLGKFILIK